MTSITFYGGVNEIGGNKILVEDKGTRIFLDFGKSFGVWGRYFEEYMKPTVSRGIETFWKTGLLPDIQGVYRPDLLEFAGVTPQKEPSVDAVLLSHAHQDHAAYISFLDSRIPVYCSEVTRTVLQAVQEISQRDLESEVANYKPRPLLRKDYKKPPIQRDIQTANKIKIGSIEAHFLPVDHSVPGACGIILHCSDATIVYSGDLRLHGTEGHLTQEFAETAGLEKPDAFLCEGTRVDSTDNHDETFVKTNSAKTVEETKNLVFADFSWKDTTRFLTFYETAKQSGRQLLIPFRTAHYIQALKPFIPALPGLKDENILLYQEKAGSGTYDDADYAGWTRPFLSHPNTVNAGYINKHQEKIMACLGYYDLIDLVDVKPSAGSAYVHSLSEPFCEEMEFDFNRLKNWLSLFGIPYHHFHASGHAPRQDLFKVIEKIAPKKLLPIHTEHPELFKEAKVLKEGEPFIL